MSADCPLTRKVERKHSCQLQIYTFLRRFDTLPCLRYEALPLKLTMPG
jgi:hypothetical protein